MKKISSILALCALVVTAHAQSTITINFDVGVLANNSGIPVADGSLLQIIASPDVVFDAPSDASFITGNDLLIYSWAFDSATSGMNGVATFEMNVNLSQFPVVGHYLAVRWYPTLSSQSIAPGFNTFYGEYGYVQDSSWVAPAAGNIIGLQMITVALGGSVADSLGQAALQTPIPEPSTYAAIFGALALGFVAYRRRLANAA